jgi:molybdopterin-guanine dinucleotide biosynthesis protein A
MAEMTIAAAILAGGQGRRLGGVKKALLSVGGHPIFVRQIEVLSPLVDEILIVGGAPFALQKAPRVRHVADVPPSLGPLSGLKSAFLATTAETLLVVGCDLPFLDRGLLTLVRDHAPSAEIVVPRLQGRPQPLHARYRRTLLPRVEERLLRRTLRITELLDAAEVSFLDAPILTEHARHRDLRGLRGINTAAELAWARTQCSPDEKK